MWVCGGRIRAGMWGLGGVGGGRQGQGISIAEGSVQGQEYAGSGVCRGRSVQGQEFAGAGVCRGRSV